MARLGSATDACEGRCFPAALPASAPRSAILVDEFLKPQTVCTNEPPRSSGGHAASRPADGGTTALLHMGDAIPAAILGSRWIRDLLLARTAALPAGAKHPPDCRFEPLM